ncbi:hypothetical protein [Bacillus cereus]|uniref:hypothetical protein n=4 Tax=Bacillaceae TaxID=186817 RepID=UPI00396CC410
MVAVEVPGTEADKEAEKKAKAAERQRKSRANKKAAASKKTSSPANGDQIKIMLLTMSTIMASRPGMEMWMLSPDEAEQIVTPLSSIMAKSNVGESLGEYADHIALAIACFTILVPKFIAWQASKPKKKEVQNPYVRANSNTNRTSTNESGKAPASSGPSRKQPTDALTNVGGFISEIIPPSVGVLVQNLTTI